jgi:hypothetical protein
MDEIRSLLAQAQLSLLPRQGDYELQRIHEIIGVKALVDGRADLEELFGILLAHREPHGPPPRPKTLDLVGHSTAGESLLRLGDWVIDASKPAVTAFFRELADQDVLPRLGVYALRLIGCATASTEAGRATICALASILDLEVYGTTTLVYSAHYGPEGFKREWSNVLVAASDLRRETSPAEPPLFDPYPRALDVDSLPAAPLTRDALAWPLRIATADAASHILRLVRRTTGAQRPGLLTAPHCELALPAAQPGHYHTAQVVLDGEFLRVYPDGAHRPGIVYAVLDARALRSIADQLPLA